MGAAERRTVIVTGSAAVAYKSCRFLAYLQRDQSDLERQVPFMILATFFLFIFSSRYPDSSKGKESAEWIDDRAHNLCTALFGSVGRLKLMLVICSAVLFLYVSTHGIDYVSWPRLNSLQEVISYSGKGFESGRHGRGPGSYWGSHKQANLQQDRKASLQGVGEPLGLGNKKKTPSHQQAEWDAELGQGQGKKRMD